MVSVINRIPAPALLMLRASSKYITMLEASSGDGLLDLGPLSDEISKHQRLDRRPASEFNGVSAELDNALDDMAIGLFVAEDVP